MAPGMPNTCVTPRVSSVRTTSSAPVCCALFEASSPVDLRVNFGFSFIVDLLVSLFRIGEFLGGVLAEIRLQERFRLGQRQVKIRQRLDLETERTGFHIEQVSAVLAIL